ncbi:MAG: hypothetical protein C0407_17715 [Desulfobacca sp.]|nr:hypothetical protein [Desulfobacca sp.]
MWSIIKGKMSHPRNGPAQGDSGDEHVRGSEKAWQEVWRQQCSYHQNRKGIKIFNKRPALKYDQKKNVIFY